jgi:hypothetical protein
MPFPALSTTGVEAVEEDRAGDVDVTGESRVARAQTHRSFSEQEKGSRGEGHGGGGGAGEHGSANTKHRKEGSRASASSNSRARNVKSKIILLGTGDSGKVWFSVCTLIMRG